MESVSGIISYACFLVVLILHLRFQNIRIENLEEKIRELNQSLKDFDESVTHTFNEMGVGDE